MGHYAKVIDGKVAQVIVAKADFFDIFVDTKPGPWIQVSYNTRLGVHYEPNSDTPSADQSKALRGNYPCIGDIYDAVNDKFYAPQPFPSWTLNTTKWDWDAPTAYPTDGKRYAWDEATLNWVLLQDNTAEP
jgi:hypothetical protein